MSKSLGIPPHRGKWQWAAEVPISKEGGTRRSQKVFELRAFPSGVEWQSRQCKASRCPAEDS